VRYSQFFDLRAGVHFEREPELAFPLFDRGGAAAARAEAQLRQAQDRYAALAIEIRSQVRAARERLVTARQMVEYYREVVSPRRQRILDQTQLQFNCMLVGVYQLLQAKHDHCSSGDELQLGLGHRECPAASSGKDLLR
jgi:cobalt-zinc-cadmium efflux system outer membrane protein